jgi:integrase
MPDERMEAIGSAWKRTLARADIQDFHFHDLRHTWASWHVMQGTSLARVDGTRWMEVV